ncbi:exodeoxyribonuclease V subunit gamma [Trinickia mobilis]|uniref:exodeoxyribonuclease V subunit gamma n=1 Tax=Trinickia mobilis TaxID=2816356 RepID=UPI001F5DFF2A|nr:exodeoxyribonuclease V subunit gamma [Trinickia mobilis]
MTTQPLPAGLMLIHGNQPERLRDLMLEWIRQYPLAPLENEVILVQSNGIAQWLKLAFAADPGHGGCGISAALDLSLPARFLWQVYRAVLGADAVPDISPFDKSRLVWRLTRLLPSLLDQPEFAPLRRFMAHDDDQRKRFQLAQRVADLFDQYQVYRADWLARWSGGEDVLIDARDAQSLLPDEHRWQAALWRALLDDVGLHGPAGIDASKAGRAAVHQEFMRRAAALPEGEQPRGLPRRVIVFGISSLPLQSLEVLAALARFTQVLMCVHNPCAHYWADIVADQDLLRATRSRQRRREGAPAIVDEAQLHLHAHRLLAAWGKQGRDFIGLLDEFDSDAARDNYASRFASIGQRIDLFESDSTATMLQQLQDDIRDLRTLVETRERWPAVDPREDRSIRFHIAHSAQREVEILHDQLLAAFAGNAMLRPRDVIVMVPDIETYAPHIQAVFGLLDISDPRYIPFSVADRGQRSFDPLLGALETLLALPQSRVTASDVLDLLEVPALRARFGIAADDLPKLHNWIGGANIRWGLHGEQRASLDLPRAGNDDAPNSWAFGLRRMLLGYAVGDKSDAWQGIEPFAEIGGLDAALLGPLTRLVDALDETWRTLRGPATVEAWCRRLRELKNRFFAPVDSDDAYTLDRLDAALEAWHDACDDAALTDALPLSIVADHWLSQLDEGSLSQRFFAGAVTFATLMPMRAIPFRHVCLLGMNDGDYPRTRMPLDFDLMRQSYRPGDRSRREDDRYLFLEALLSAREHLHVSWVGRSVTDNTPRPPSVLVGQLREHLSAGWHLAGDESDKPDALLDALTVVHRLQPFSAEYFPADPAESKLFTFASEWREASAGDQAEPGMGAAFRPLSPLERVEPLSVRELTDFLRDPIKSFFRQRLRVAFETDAMASENDEPFDLDGLTSWQLQSELIRAQTAALERGVDDVLPAAQARLARMHRSGDLAAGGFGELLGDALMEPMSDLFERYRAALARWPQTPDEAQHELRLDATIDGRERSLEDWIVDVRTDAQGARGRVILEASSLVKDNKYRRDKVIVHWVAHLAAQLAAGPVTTVVVSKVGSVELEPLTEEDARAALLALLRAWDEGVRRPLPLAVNAAFAWLGKRPQASAGVDVADGETGNDHWRADAGALAEAREAARATYEGTAWQSGECASNAYLHRVYPDFEALAASGEFEQLAIELLLPLHLAIPASTKTKNSSKTGGEAQ